jgi:hypothetical protein
MGRLWPFRALIYNIIGEHDVLFSVTCDSLDQSDIYIATGTKLMQYISLSWSEIPEFVVPIMISLIGVAANKEAAEPRAPSR